MGALSSTQA